MDVDDSLYYIVYKQYGSNWSFSTKTITGKPFTNKMDLLPMERLLPLLTGDEQKQQAIVFVHKSLFCGAAKSQDLAIKACQLSYEYNLANGASGASGANRSNLGLSSLCPSDFRYVDAFIIGSIILLYTMIGVHVGEIYYNNHYYVTICNNTKK